VTVKATDTATVTNAGTYTGPGCTSAPCKTNTVTNPVAAISWTKSVTPASGATVAPGQTLTYTLTATNNGTGTGTSTLTDAAPAGTTLVGASAKCGTVPATGACTVTSATTPVGFKMTLPAKGSMSVSFKVTVKATDTATVTNAGTYTGPGCTSAPCKTNTVTNPVVVLTAIKEQVPASGSTVPVNALITYSIVLTDSGTGAATDVTVTDTVPAGSTYVANSATCGGVPGCSAHESGTTVTWSPVTVGVGPAHAVTLTFQVSVNANDRNGQIIANVAVFTNEGTPSCTGPTCTTNTVTAVVTAPTSSPTTSTSTTTTQPKSGSPSPTTPPKVPTGPITGATTVHTGEPWAGSGRWELGATAAGLGLLVAGAMRRRRWARRH
jgi:uncharacterized repeat protein (TIGR01451 family)